jgi:hypothetical protein
MKISVSIPISTVAIATLQAATTIDSTDKYAWAGNLGWANWHDLAATGAVIGEYVCSGYLWSANCGWIHLGDGSADNGIFYSNTSGSDYGVNVQEPTAGGGDSMAKLRGYAYSGNLGWIHFENQGNPRICFETGRLTGYIWSANCGWINLDDASHFVVSNAILPGIDSDSDGIADAFEFIFTVPDNLAVLSETGDFDGDGITDLDEYLAATDPTDSSSILRITNFTITTGGYSLTWTSSPARFYRIISSTSLLPGSWELRLDQIVPDGDSTMREFTAPAADKQFFRVEVFKPLVP